MENIDRNQNLLFIDGLHTYFFTSDGLVKAVDGVSLSLDKGHTLGIVGESGCGKTVLILSIMRLIQSPGRTVQGHILFDNKDLLSLDREEMRKIRGGDISMIFQDPMTSLNPVFTIGSQISEVFLLHDKEVSGSKKLALEKTIDALRMVAIPSPEKRVRDYPHQLSGGMCQRVMIAMALACKPKLMLADEPTTALDVTTQAQILSLMNDLKEKIGTSIVLVTHDLGIVAEMCQDVAVMYTGKIMEYASVWRIFENPLHPYTKGLLKSLPTVKSKKFQDRLYTIPGTVPSYSALPPGCLFYGRCDVAMDVCAHEKPPVCYPESDHMVRCWRYNI